jgi:hypothetical protein
MAAAYPSYEMGPYPSFLRNRADGTLFVVQRSLGLQEVHRNGPSALVEPVGVASGGEPVPWLRKWLNISRDVTCCGVSGSSVGKMLHTPQGLLPAARLLTTQTESAARNSAVFLAMDSEPLGWNLNRELSVWSVVAGQKTTLRSSSWQDRMAADSGPSGSRALVLVHSSQWEYAPTFKSGRRGGPPAGPPHPAPKIRERDGRRLGSRQLRRPATCRRGLIGGRPGPSHGPSLPLPSISTKESW